MLQDFIVFVQIRRYLIFNKNGIVVVAYKNLVPFHNISITLNVFLRNRYLLIMLRYLELELYISPDLNNIIGMQISMRK